MITRTEAMLIAKYIRNTPISPTPKRELVKNITVLFESTTPGFRGDLFYQIALGRVEKDSLNHHNEVKLEEKLNDL